MRTCVAAVVLLALVAAACTDDGEPEAADPGLIHVRRVAADPTGGGWLLGSTEQDAFTVHHLAKDGTVEQVAVVPEGSYFDLLALPDGRLALAGVRCDDDCQSTVTEILFIDRDGEIDASEALARHDYAFDEENLPGISLVGEVDGSIWVTTSSRHQLLSPSGEVEQQLDLRGDSCVIDGDLYELWVSPHAATTVDTIEPVRPDHYVVSRLSGSQLSIVDELDAPAGSWNGECAGDEMSVNETVRRRDYWDPAGGWTVGEWADDPSPAGAMAVLDASGHRLVVDADGTVMVRRRGQWVDLPLRHELAPGTPRQYHAADLSRGVLVSCIGPTYPLVLADVSCTSATSVDPWSDAG